MSFLSELFFLSLVIGCLIGSFVMMFSPKRATGIFKRLGIAFLCWQAILFCLCLLERKLTGLTWSWGGRGTFLLVLVALVVSCVAHVIYKIKWGTPKKPLEQRGAERTPQIPPYHR